MGDMGLRGIPVSSIAIAEKCLSENPEIAKGWVANGREFVVPDLSPVKPANEQEKRRPQPNP